MAEPVSLEGTEINSQRAEAAAGPAAPLTAVAGVSGYAGAELARLLLHHPRLRLRRPIFLSRPDAPERAPQHLSDLHPQLAESGPTQDVIVPFSWEALADRGVDLLFLALPHDQSRAWVPSALEHGIRVVDLSGAWRLQQPVNRAVYQFSGEHDRTNEAIQREAVYGCPELHRTRIASARLVANPGCYATSVILALAPLLEASIVDLRQGIVCDSKSGVSGAGKSPTPKTHFMYAADNFSAYSVFGHRHTGELLEQLHLSSDQIQFTPHLLPIPRGILSTIYVKLTSVGKPEVLSEIFRKFYQDSPLVRVHRYPQLPQIQHVVRTNFCDLGFELSPDGTRLVLVSCLDNLLKGASGQAIQNMNLMFGWGEEEGLL